VTGKRVRTGQAVRSYYRAMLPPGYLSRLRAAGTSGRPPAGPAMSTLRSAAVATASIIRCIAIAYIAVQVVIWHSFYAADPWRLAGPVAAVGWAVALVAYLLRRWPTWQLAGIDSGVHVALALGAMWCVPPAMRGDTANWLYILVAGQLVVPAWFAPGAVLAPLALASGTAYWAGSVLAMGAGSGNNSPIAAGILLLAIAAVVWCGYLMLYRRSAAADAALAQADRYSRQQYVILSRNTERREHERMLHDTVLNTLTALRHAGSGDPEEVVGRCRHDVTLMEYVLRDPGDPARVASRPYGGLLIGIEAVAMEMRARGLDVHVETTHDAAAEKAGAAPGKAGAGGAGARAAAGSGPVVPVPVAAAMAHAVREALANVAGHAGTGEAWVEISMTAAGPGAAEPGGLHVTVRDAGRGFDPDRVDTGRLGLRRSVIERIADQGGQASVQSSPGEGTVVSIAWTAQEPGHPGVASGAPGRSARGQGVPAVDAAGQGGPGQGVPAVDAAGQGVPAVGGSAMAAGDRAVQDAAESELPRMAGTIAVIWQFALLIQVLIYLHDYRQPAVPLAVWLGLLAAAGWLVPRARAPGFSGPDAAVAVAVAVAAVALVGWDRRMHGTGTVDWSVIGTSWLLALVALSRPAREWIFGALLVFTAHAVFFIRDLGVTSLGLARLAATAETLVVILAVFAALRPTLRAHARIAAHSTALASRAAAKRAVAAAVREDRRRRLALLEVEALPLLRGIADGTLDPADREIRERCVRHAATLRRALADRPRKAGGVLAELEPALSAAKARGLPVEVQVVGDPGRPMREVAGATLAAVDGVMSALPPHPVTLTVLASGEDVELYVTFDRPPRTTPDVAELRLTVPARARWHAAVDVDDTGAGCLEVRWWKEMPA
jgi:signal transduction histidine kinase